MERIPILKMGEFLLVTIQVDMHDRLALQLQEDLTERIAATRASGVLIDISSLEMVDSFIGRMMGNIAGMSKVLAAQAIKSDRLPIRTTEDIVIVRQHVRKLALELGLSLVDQTKAVTAASEIARNTLIYGKGGWATVEVVERG